MQSDLVPGFNDFYPGKFCDKTNGVTPRRWLMNANPGLSDWISERIGDQRRDNLDAIRRLEPSEPFAHNRVAQQSFMVVKQMNKQRLAHTIWKGTGIGVDTNSLFDIQVKRIHEYKRQLTPLSANSIFPVPEASIPAVEICSL